MVYGAIFSAIAKFFCWGSGPEAVICQEITKLIEIGELVLTDQRVLPEKALQAGYDF